MNSNIIINIPHSSTNIPENFYERLVINNVELKRKLVLLTDLYTDEIYKNENCNIIKADISRIVCDIERFRNDKDEQMSLVGMGVVYTKTSEGKSLIESNAEYRKNILENYYDPYHKKFEELTDLIISKYKRCIIIDGHSFSTKLLKNLGFQFKDSPDICLGFEEKFVDNNILEILKKHFESNGLSVKFNYPYSGSIVPTKYYIKNDSRVKSIMIEVNKSIYLDNNNQKNEQYSKLKHIIQSGIEKVLDYEKTIS